MNLAETLAETTLTKGLPEARLEVLAGYAKLESFEVGEGFLSREDVCFPLMVLVKGEGEVRGLFGQPVSLLKRGDLIGEMAFLDRGVRSADVVVTKSAEVAVFPEDLFESLNQEHPDIAATVLLNLSHVLCAKLRWAIRLMDANEAVSPLSAG